MMYEPTNVPTNITKILVPISANRETKGRSNNVCNNNTNNRYIYMAPYIHVTCAEALLTVTTVIKISSIKSVQHIYNGVKIKKSIIQKGSGETIDHSINLVVIKLLVVSYW